MTFHDHTVDSAPAAARPILAATVAQLGFLPVAMGRLAEAPTVLDAFGRLNQIWERGSLDAREREVVVFTVAHHSGCDLCVAFHSVILAGQGEVALMEALRADRALEDPRLEELRVFTRAVIEARGGVADGAMARFHAAGFTNQQALDVVLGVATYTLSTFANRLVKAPVDPQLVR